MKPAVLLALLGLAACNPYKQLRRDQAELAPLGAVELKVPKGYKEARTDTEAGGRVVRSYRYGNGAVFYVAYVPDRGNVQPIDRAEHVPGLSPVGDTLFKQQGGSGRYWREDRKGLLRAGYINVDEGKSEALFDSAVNYVRSVRR